MSHSPSLSETAPAKKHEYILWFCASYIHFGGLMWIFNICITTWSLKKKKKNLSRQLWHNVFSRRQFYFDHSCLLLYISQGQIIIHRIWFRPYVILKLSANWKIFLPKPIFIQVLILEPWCQTLREK